jgi:phenylalanyl-tRNA synthetase beta chain
MKFTFNWLKEYVDVEQSAAEIADRLTMLGLEVDSVVDLHQGLEEIRIGQVLTVVPHPNADRLTVCSVQVGGDNIPVVCGAPNVRPGQYTAVALPGIRLPSGMVVREAKIRGVVSKGMLCSEKELGLSDDHSGIMDIAPPVSVDDSFIDIMGLNDTVIEVDLTPNRPDCASVIGIAREVAGFTGKKLQMAAVACASTAPYGDGGNFSVEIKAPADCPRYAARLLRNVRIAPSPRWLRQRLLHVGLRPINNIVDITNLVMMEYGQPLHAFDFARLAGGRIVVRLAEEGEKFTTLDSIDRELDAEMLLICDAEKPVAIAGIMGGLNSEVSEATTEVLLESAYFNPISIRRTARKLHMATDASYRFERGVDAGGTRTAMERAVQLMIDIAGGEPVPEVVDNCPGLTEPPLLILRVQRTGELLGMELSAEEIAARLRAIDIEAAILDADTLQVRPPTFRVDLEREIDLVEEVARVIGFNEIPSTLPAVPMSFPEHDRGRELRQQVEVIMTSLGFSEAVNYSFGSDRHGDRLNLAADDAARRTVKLLNPLSDEQNVMRTMLLPGLLENVQHNVNRQTTSLRLFETGKVFLSRAEGDTATIGQPEEITRVTGVLSGRRHPASPLLHFGTAQADILDAKGAAEVLLLRLRLDDAHFDYDNSPNEVPPYVEPGTCMRLKAGSMDLGVIGQVHGGVLKNFGIKQPVYFFDIDLDALQQVEPAPKSYISLPKFPSVNWDIAMLVPEKTPVGDVLGAVADCGEEIVERVELFDIYRGKAIEAGFKSVALSVTYRSQSGTLDDSTVEKVHRKIINLLETEFSGRLREANTER